MLAEDHLRIRKPLCEAESQLVKMALKAPGKWSDEIIDTFRYVMSFARLTTIRNDENQDVDVAEFLARHRWWVIHGLRKRLLPEASGFELQQFLPELVQETVLMRRRLEQHFGISRAGLDAEVCHRQLVVVCGGGGGGGYGYAGAFLTLHRHELQPQLLAGTSIGALLSMFRSRHIIYDQLPMIEAAKRLKWNTVFRVLDMNSRYGVPATLRLYLRHAIGSMFKTPAGEPITFQDCEIPLLIVTTGLTVDSFKHDMDYYEHFMDDALRSGFFRLSKLRKMSKMFSILQDFLSNSDALREVVFGADDITMQADVLDAAGFSAAIPGLIHYDVLRDAPHMTQILDQLYGEYGITRLGEGGLVNNVPARPAFTEVMRGRLKHRNPFVMALDCFSPQPSSLIWYPVQQLVQRNVRQNLPYADFYMGLQKRLTAINVVPSVRQITRAINWTVDELAASMPYISWMCRSHATIADEMSDASNI